MIFLRGNRGRVDLTNDERRVSYETLSEFDMMSDNDKIRIPALLLVGEFDGLNPPSES